MRKTKTNTAALLAIIPDENGYTLGAGKSRHYVHNVAFKPIKENILKRATILKITCNASESYVGEYSFPQTVLENDAFLRALLFGRSTTNFQFVATNAICAQLVDKYGEYITNFKPIDEYDFTANCGIQFEEKCVENGAKKTSTIMDKRYKVDVVENHHNVQLKASIKHMGTNGKSYSYSKTNGSVK